MNNKSIQVFDYIVKILTNYLELKHEPSGVRVICSHYPMLSWNQKHRGSWMLHGHCHGQMTLPESLKDARIFDVEIDNLYKVFGTYAPVSLDEIIDYKECQDNLFVLES